MQFLTSNGVYTAPASSLDAYVNDIVFTYTVASGTTINVTTDAETLTPYAVTLINPKTISVTTDNEAFTANAASLKYDWKIAVTTATEVFAGRKISLYIGGVLQGTKVRWISRQASRILGLIGFKHGPFNSRNQ